MIDINDYTSCWVCDNIVDHQEQIGLLHLDFPRCFILIPDNTAFQMECADDFHKEYCQINWLILLKKSQKRRKEQFWIGFGTFLQHKKGRKKNLAADREIDDFLYGDAL